MHPHRDTIRRTRRLVTHDQSDPLGAIRTQSPLHGGVQNCGLWIAHGCPQDTVTVGCPGSPSAAPILSAMRMASSIRVSTILDSGTVLMTSPLTKIWPLPLPEATPRSASR